MRTRASLAAARLGATGKKLSRAPRTRSRRHSTMCFPHRHHAHGARHGPPRGRGDLFSRAATPAACARANGVRKFRSQWLFDLRRATVSRDHRCPERAKRSWLTDPKICEIRNAHERRRLPGRPFPAGALSFRAGTTASFRSNNWVFLVRVDLPPTAGQLRERFVAVSSTLSEASW